MMIARLLQGILILGWLFVSAQAFGSSDEEKRVLILGDSLTAGFGLEPGQAFPDQLEVWLSEQGHNIRVINAGISGDTTTGGRARLAWVLDGQAYKPDLVVVELGGNDVLRSIPIDVTRQNMIAMLQTLSARDIPVMIAGMMAAPNLGPDYERDFNALFPALSAEYNASLYPFFLDGVVSEEGFRADLHQADGLHPNADGVKVIVERFGPALVKALGKIHQ